MLDQAATTTAIGAGTAFALLLGLLIILVVMGLVTRYLERRQADRVVSGDSHNKAEEDRKRSRATAATVAVAVLKSDRSLATGRED